MKGVLRLMQINNFCFPVFYTSVGHPLDFDFRVMVYILKYHLYVLGQRWPPFGMEELL